MKKLIIPVVLMVIVILLLTACGTNSPTTTAPATTAPTTAATTTTAPVTTAPATTASTTTAASPTQTSAPTTTAENIQKGGTLKYLYPYTLTNIPGWPDDDSNVQRMLAEWTVFEPLVKLKADGTPMPWLATSWQWGPQNLSITFTLRQGVLFSDGTPFTSEAVKLEADQVMSTKEAQAITWDHWQIVDDYHITLYLKQYHNDFWTTISNINMCFFSPTAYQAHGEDWMKDNPIGTGPFMFKSFNKDVSLILVRNPNYWQTGKPYLNEIDIMFVTDPMTAQAALQSGEGDLLAFQQGKILSDMKKAGFNILAAYGGTDFLLFDTGNANSQFSDVRVRQAIEYALDKQAMVDANGYGYLVVNNQLPPPNNPAYDPNIGTRSYDPAKAKQLLAEAGYPNGFSTTLITDGSSPAAMEIQQYLQAININVNIEAVDNAKYWNYSMKGWTGMMFAGYAVGPNFPSWLQMYFPPTGVLDVSAKLPDNMLSQIAPALSEIDPTKAKADSNELIQMMFDDATVVPIDSNAMGYILSPKVHDTGIYDYLDFSVWTPEDTWLSK